MPSHLILLNPSDAQGIRKRQNSSRTAFPDGRRPNHRHFHLRQRRLLPTYAARRHCRSRQLPASARSQLRASSRYRPLSNFYKYSKRHERPCLMGQELWPRSAEDRAVRRVILVIKCIMNRGQRA